MGKDIDYPYIKYTFSVIDYSCIGSTFKVLNVSYDLWKVNDSPSWHSLDTIFVAGRKRMQLPSYHKVISRLVGQVVHKISMYLIQFSKWLSKQVFPSITVERKPVQILILHNSDLRLSAFKFTYHIIRVGVINTHSQLRFHGMKCGVLDIHE